MKLYLTETKEILDFEKEIGYELEVHERKYKHWFVSSKNRYYACFQGAELADNGRLIGKQGNGDTIDSAIKDYCVKVSSETIVFYAGTPNRKEIKFPRLVHTQSVKL
jgi:hypothetical protein